MSRKTAAAQTSDQFLATLPSPAAEELKQVRDLVRRHLPAGYQEVVRKHMIVWEVPLARYAGTSNKQPLWYAALGAEKRYLTLHLMPVYASRTLQEKLAVGFQAAGKKLNMGKACIRFQSAQDLAPDVVGEVVGSVPLEKWVDIANAVKAWRP